MAVKVIGHSKLMINAFRFTRVSFQTGDGCARYGNKHIYSTQELSNDRRPEWLSKRSFLLHGHRFNIMGNSLDFATDEESTSGDQFCLAKDPGLIIRYMNLFENFRPEAILEVGIMHGGSTAFLQLLAKPDRLLALELSPEPLDILEQFIANEGLQDFMHVAYGVDQANAELVRSHVLTHLGNERCIDVVIDDASHQLAPTRTTFDTVFPLLRPGARYIIEDFAGAHIVLTGLLDDATAGSEHARNLLRTSLASCLQADQKPLHLLAVEAMLASIVAPEVISRVVVDRHWLTIMRGPKSFDDNKSFSLGALAKDYFSLLDSAPSSVLESFLS